MKPLTENQKFQLIRLLKDLASADHNITLSEATRIRLIGLKLDMTPEKISEALSEDFEPTKTYLAHFTEMEHRKYVYQQCVLLVKADRDVTFEELEEITLIQDEFQLDPEFCKQVQAWVDQGIAWDQQGQEMVGGKFSE